MQRIAIIGCGGSGKSTLAIELGQALSLPVCHLDRLYWKPGWTPTPDEEWEAVVRRLCGQPSWIIDGNFGGTLDVRLSASDTVIFLDLPTRVCLWSAIRRFLAYRGRSRPDMGEGCHEKLNLKYLWWILTYRSKRRPRTLRKLSELSSDKRVVIRRSRKSARSYLATVCQELLSRESLPLET
jgi:adenylate kinase family enzyme